MPTDDLYVVLGVLPDAEDVVVKAAYKALAQRYHPDRWTGDPAEAHRRMRDINNAYSVLGDSARRSEYDKSRPKADQATYAEESTADQDAAFTSALNQIEERWQVACSIYPDLRDLRARLAKISTSLSFAFVTVSLESKAFTRRTEIASHLENVFLKRYFGTNPQIIDYARELITDGHKEAARSLNELVDVLGSDVDPNLLIARVDNKYGLKALRERARQDAVQRLAGKKLVDAVRTQGYYDDAQRLVEIFGYKVSEVGGGFFKSGEILVVSPDCKELLFKNPTAFIHWVQKTFSRDQ